jgi:hypothetical protein
MKTIEVYNFTDLTKEVKDKVFNEFVNYQIEADLNTLEEDLNANLITEDNFYKILGCDKSYAESTAWFVPACYYEQNKKQVDRDVKNTLKTALFTKQGKFIQAL